MSWDSVVEHEPSIGAMEQPVPSLETLGSPVDPGPIAASPSVPLTQPAPPASAVSSEPYEPISFVPLMLAPYTDDGTDTAPSAPRATGVAEAASSAVTVADDAPPAVKLAPLIPLVAALGEIEPAPTSAPTATAVSTPATEVPDTPVISTELPQIVEATPVQDATTPALEGLLGSGSEAAYVDLEPRLPAAQPLERTRGGSTPVEIIEQLSPTPAAGKQRRGKGRRGIKLVLVLLVLVGLVAACVVLGRAYLVPTEWDSTTEPYAVAVEEARGVEFVEPIELISEPTPEYTARMSSELTGEWLAEQPMWRALGLLSGPVTEASVATVLAGQRDAIYSTGDGQVYRDGAAVGPDADAQITEAMVAASLDQEFGWSVDQPNRTLDDAAQTLAEVRREARQVQRSTQFALELEANPVGGIFLVPPVLGYRTFAPTVYSEFAGPHVALAGIGAGGPGPLPTDTPVLAPEAVMTGTDVSSGAPVALDRSFWYMALAGYLDTQTAYWSSEAIVENSVVLADRAGTQCVYATFAGGDVAQTATLRASLEWWSATVPAEFASSFSVLADGTMQLVTCDPGVGFENPSRLGVAHELIGWRMAELATIEAVTAAGGAEAELAIAWASVEASNVGVELASRPPETTPVEAATAARDAVRAVLAPAG